MTVMVLQARTAHGWKKERELWLEESQKISLITDRGKKLMEQDLAHGKTGFCHWKFNANIQLQVTEDLQFRNMRPGDQLAGEEVILSIQRVGKTCHSVCPIHSSGSCAFLLEIGFLEVLQPGRIRIRERLNYINKNTII